MGFSITARAALLGCTLLGCIALILGMPAGRAIFGATDACGIRTTLCMAGVDGGGVGSRLLASAIGRIALCDTVVI